MGTLSLRVEPINCGKYKIVIEVNYPLPKTKEDTEAWNEAIQDGILMINFFKLVDDDIELEKIHKDKILRSMK